MTAGWFDYYNESVQYEFGYGLSYTTFGKLALYLDIGPERRPTNTTFAGMGNVSVTRTSEGSISASPPDAAIVPGGNPRLWDTLFSVSVSVTNTGSLTGAAVPQLYLGLPQPANQDVTPVKVLRGFNKILLQPGESQTVTFDLTRRDISYWDIVTQQWVIGTSAIGVMAGFSSRDILATTTFSPLSSTAGGGYGGSSGSGQGDHQGPWHWSSNENRLHHWGPPGK